MAALLAASLLWAFSFGLIKGQLAGVSPLAVAAGRVAIAAAILLPVAGRRVAAPRARLEAALLGAVQFGLMYVLYVASFRWLAAWVVALLTVFTPLYVLLFARATDSRRRGYLAAVLAVGGAALLCARGAGGAAGWPGVLLLQGSNLCFAWGQVRFVALRRRWAAPDLALVAWMYAGAAAATAVAVALATAGGHDPAAGWTRRSLLVLLYLGALPTAAGFYLWNRGAARTAPALLAVANNLKVPLAVLVAWFAFGEARPTGAAVAGLALLLAALVLAGDRPARRGAASAPPAA